jgi:hypothetical protein
MLEGKFVERGLLEVESAAAKKGLPLLGNGSVLT